jgi:hypothetical protein
MVIREPFDLSPQHGKPRFVPIYVVHEMKTGIPDVGRVFVDGCEDIEEVFDVHILRRDPSCFFETGLVRIDINRQPTEVALLGGTKERRRLWILGAKVVPEGCQHCDESVASIRQGENAKFVENLLPVRDVQEQPVKVVLIDTLGEESDHFKERAGVRAEFLEQGGSE